jgi:hypothetical protein
MRFHSVGGFIFGELRGMEKCRCNELIALDRHLLVKIGDRGDDGLL